MPILYQQLPLLGITKVCFTCKLEYLTSQFQRNKCTKDGYSVYCRACACARHALSRAKHHEKRLAEKAVYRATHADAVRAAKKRCYEAKKQQYNAKVRANQQAHPEQTRSWKKAWKQRNPEKVQEARMRYNARKQGATISPVSYPAIWARDSGICHLCALPVDRKDVHYDHVIPLSRGGAHSMENIKVSHARCNERKHDKLMSELREVIQ